MWISERTKNGFEHWMYPELLTEIFVHDTIQNMAPYFGESREDFIPVVSSR